MLQLINKQYSLTCYTNAYCDICLQVSKIISNLERSCILKYYPFVALCFSDVTCISPIGISTCAMISYEKQTISSLVLKLLRSESSSISFYSCTRFFPFIYTSCILYFLFFTEKYIDVY